MLESLHIENVAVIKRANITFGKGFTVLTGETGAGKSIIIDSVNLLLGARPQRELVRTGATAALASGMFSSLTNAFCADMEALGVQAEEDGTLLIERTLSSEGKASTRLNGRPTTVSAQRELSSQLLTIHGQHDNGRFLKPENHILYLDEYANIGVALDAYTVCYRAYRETENKMRSLQKNESEKARLTELLKYQIADIDAGKLKPREEEALLEKRAKIRNLEKITKQVNTVYAALYQSEKGYSATEQIERAVHALEQLSDIMPSAAEMAEKLSGFRYEMEDIAETVLAFADDDVDDPTALLDKIEGRLETISRLKKKYGATVEDVLAFRARIAIELEEISSSDKLLGALAKQRATEKKALIAAAAVLTEQRRVAGEVLSEKIMEELSFLDMEKVRFAVDIKPYKAEDADASAFTARGCDTVEFLISTNTGEPLKPLDKIASGGELSRIMLAAQCATAKDAEMQTMIFDEVDTGVSGKTSQKIGMKLKSLARSGCQVLCVTHSAQIAALADAHLYISKSEVDGRVETKVTELDREGRIAELSRIIGGLSITDTVRKTAEELLNGGALC